LPKVVTQHCLEQDLNPRPTDRKPKCLTRCTTAPPPGIIVSYVCQFLVVYLPVTQWRRPLQTTSSSGSSPMETSSRTCPVIQQSSTRCHSIKTAFLFLAVSNIPLHAVHNSCCVKACVHSVLFRGCFSHKNNIAGKLGSFFPSR